MPFSSLTDPGELARATRVLDAAWGKVMQLDSIGSDPERERARLAYAVAALLKTTASEDDLIDAAVTRFLGGREQEI